jgi:MFS family permease
LLVALAGAAVIAASQPVRASLDADRSVRNRITLAGLFAPLALLRSSSALRDLALVALAYSATQVCLTSFLVVYLTESLGFTRVGAGLALTSATLGGVAGRIGWGYVADRFLRPRVVLVAIGLLSAACGLGMAAAASRWPSAAIAVLAALFGATAIGWNGVQLAEVARLAPPGQAGKVTGASGFISFGGIVVGPPLFALLAALTGSYRSGFAAVAALSGCAALALLRRPDRIQ